IAIAAGVQSPSLGFAEAGVAMCFSFEWDINSELIRQSRGQSRSHGRQVIAPRKIVDIRAQGSPIALRLRTVVPLGHYLIDARCAVHDLLHLYFCLQVVRGGIEFATQTICGTI